MASGAQETLICAVYYAPRGRARLYRLGREIAQRHLYPEDLLIGVIGEQGSGKSTLIRGVFPGLELTNDDEGINMPTSPVFDFSESERFGPHTYHLDVRYEQAFHQMYEIVDAVTEAIKHRKRVIVEHFDLLYPHLGFNAQVIFGVGEEVIVVRPGVFGPVPSAVKNIVYRTVKYRKMAHSAEDITSLVLSKKYGYDMPELHSDVKHGFVIGFKDKPDIDIKQLEEEVRLIIAQNIPITPDGDDFIKIGNDRIHCTGIRTHVGSSGQIEAFRLLPELKYNPLEQEYLLVGLVGENGDRPGFDEILGAIG